MRIEFPFELEARIRRSFLRTKTLAMLRACSPLVPDDDVVADAEHRRVDDGEGGARPPAGAPLVMAGTLAMGDAVRETRFEIV